MTYIQVINGEIKDFNDGFCCGNYGQRYIETDKAYKEHVSDCWCDENDVFIYDKKSKKAIYCREQWLKLRKEFKKHNKLEDGIRLGWFDKDSDKLLSRIAEFEKDISKLGYKITGNLANCIDFKKR